MLPKNPYQPHPTLNSPPQPPPQQLTTAGGAAATIFGGIDGINATFTWGVWFPVIQLFKNGVLQQSTVDYGSGPTALTFFPGSIPQPGDVLTIQGFGTI